MVKPTTLQAPWSDLAIKMGGAGALYSELQTQLQISEPTAKRLCREEAPIYLWQWDAVRTLFATHKLKF